MNIYAGNLPHGLSEEALKSVFEQYGQVNSVKIVKDWDTGRSRGFAFIEMPSMNEGKDAIEKLNGSEIEGRKIVVSEARQRQQQRGGGGGPRRRF